MRNRRILGLLLAGVALGGCRAKLTGQLTLNGATFTPTSCRSGAVFGFVGVDLINDAGAKLRLVALPDGQADALYFAPGAATGIHLGPCGPLTVQRQNSRINSVYNVEGSAALQCAAAGGTPAVAGSVQFANCH
ncbi:MAG: hypothetical protein HY909_05500 [Deltaproteobacteria bacterium]|nr:hypothetical protein [Deltaproteobacteria bacterium]